VSEMILGTATEYVELRDPGPEASWRQFRDSGMDEIIAQYHLARALSTLAQTGMASRLFGRPSMVDQVIEGFNPHIARHLLRFLEVHGVVILEENSMVALTERGKQLFSEMSLAQLGFYLEAYGPVTDRLVSLLRSDSEYGVDVQRDGAALGRHCATLFHELHTDTVLTAMAGMGAESILDLGCGGGQFLVDAAKQDESLRGIGLDISPEVIAVAKDLAEREGVADRVRFVVGDAFRPTDWPQACREADAICAHGVLHEHFRDGEDAVIRILDVYAALLRQGMKGFILGEPEIRYDVKDSDADLYLVHILTKQGFPRYREEWLSLFERSQLRCRRVLYRPDAGPRFNFFDLVPR
jgi:SAM-dependent methyltransferase